MRIIFGHVKNVCLGFLGALVTGGLRTKHRSGAHLKVAAKGFLEPLTAVTQNTSVHRPLQRLGLDDTVRALCRPE
jgi:hypothetical protein